MIEFLAVYLAPTIPAIVTFLLLKPRNVRASAHGTFAGFSLKASGGVGAYVIFMIVALLISKSLAVDPRLETKLRIELDGDRDLVDQVIGDADKIVAVFHPRSLGAKELRLERFTVLPGSKTLTSSTAIEADDLDREYTLDLRPLPPSTKSTVSDKGARPGGEASSILLKREMSVQLGLEKTSDDPLTTESSLFQSQDWTTAVSLTTLRFAPVDPGSSVRVPLSQDPLMKASEELTQLQVFMNETQQTLGEVVLTDFKNSDPAAKPDTIDAVARKLTREEFLALALRLRSKYKLFSEDSELIFNSINDIISTFETAGTEVGVLKVEHGKHLEQSRERSLELRAGDTTFRLEPIVQAVAPGECIALVTKFHYNQYWEEIKSGQQDWFGQRSPYPTRLSVISIRDDIEDTPIDVSSVVPDFTLSNGVHVQAVPTLNIKATTKFLTAQTSLTAKALKETLRWAWK